MNLDALYLVKLIFGEYFCHLDSNRITVLLQLQLYLDANRVLVHELNFPPLIMTAYDLRSFGNQDGVLVMY